MINRVRDKCKQQLERGEPKIYKKGTTSLQRSCIVAKGIIEGIAVHHKMIEVSEERIFQVGVK